MTEPLFTPTPSPARRRKRDDGPPPPARCCFPLGYGRRCEEIGTHAVLIGKRENDLTRHGICKAHLAGVLNAYAELGLNYELL